MSKEFKEKDESPERSASHSISKEDNDGKTNITNLVPSQEPRKEESLDLQYKPKTHAPSQGPSIEVPLDLQDEEDPHVILHSANLDMRNGRHAPFFISLVVNELLHNCMLDSCVSTNVMSLKVTNQFNLEITQPCRNVCGIDSRAILVCGLIKDLKVSSITYPDIPLLMDVVLIDIPNAWGMLLSRESIATLGSNLQMDLSYATIPHPKGGFVTLYRKPMPLSLIPKGALSPSIENLL